MKSFTLLSLLYSPRNTVFPRMKSSILLDEWIGLIGNYFHSDSNCWSRRIFGMNFTDDFTEKRSWVVFERRIFIEPYCFRNNKHKPVSGSLYLERISKKRGLQFQRRKSASIFRGARKNWEEWITFPEFYIF